MAIKEIYKCYSIKKDLCKEWLLYKHYAKRIPSITYSFGLFKNDILVGVLTFGMPSSPTLSASISGGKYKNIVLELNRLIVNDGLDKNALSYFVSNSINQLPKPTIIVSFSDNNMNHNGYIYQATNFIYTGKTSTEYMHIDKNGKEFHSRTISHHQDNYNKDPYIKKIKRRLAEENINKIEIAEYLKENKGNWSAKKLDKYFGYKDTAAHWFRTDNFFSFPNIDDWIKLKEIFSLDNKYDNIMLPFKWVADPKEVVKKLQLKKVKILPKNRYIYISANKKDKRGILKDFKYQKLNYPKDKNKRYDTSYKPLIQTQIF